MSKEQLLQIIKLLSALESWGFSNNNKFPDYLLETLNDVMEALEHEVMK